jgi:hypothetical protein
MYPRPRSIFCSKDIYALADMVKSAYWSILLGVGAHFVIYGYRRSRLWDIRCTRAEIRISVSCPPWNQEGWRRGERMPDYRGRALSYLFLGLAQKSSKVWCRELVISVNPAIWRHQELCPTACREGGTQVNSPCRGFHQLPYPIEPTHRRDLHPLCEAGCTSRCV